MTVVSAIDPATDRSLHTRTTSTGLATTAATGFVVAVAALHALKPEFDPSWRMVSEFEIGRHGWIMRLAFVGLGVSCLALHRALRGVVRGPAAAAGRIGLVAGTVGTVLAGVFVTDPITASKAELTTHGNIHGLGFMVGLPGLLVAVVALTRVLRRSELSPAVLVRVTRAAVLASVAAFALTMSATYDGAFTSEVPIGWPNRLLVVSLAAWIITAARLVGHRARAR